MAATQFEVIETVNNNNAEESETKIKRRKDGNPKWTRSNKQKGVSSLVRLFQVLCKHKKLI